MSTASPEQKRLGVQILTPEGSVHSGEAAMVIAPSVGGEVGILPRHVPLIVILRPGSTRIKCLDETELVLATTGGYMSVEDDTVLIMVQQAEVAANIDRPRADAARQRAEDAIVAASSADDSVALASAQAALRRADNRLKVIDKITA
ncbi:MAG: ATP synthase F1 subunit epsilon [Thermoleophilia bacterium]|nr:ATP synthase F1 subunit epsilon [Thermoleophilia bacterium]